MGRNEPQATLFISHYNRARPHRAIDLDAPVPLHRVTDNSRVVVEEANGVLVGLANVDMDSAFKFLRGYANAENVPLVDVARDLIDGRLPASKLGRVGY